MDEWNIAEAAQAPEGADEQELELPELSKKEAKALIRTMKRCFRDYRKKPADMSDEQWISAYLEQKCDGMDKAQAEENAAQIVTAITVFDEQRASLEEAAENGVSNERWLQDSIMEAGKSIPMQQFAQTLETQNSILSACNDEIASAMLRKDGGIKLSLYLEGNIAEHIHAQTFNTDAMLQGKPLKAEVLNSYNKNSVDVRVTDLNTEKYRNYQIKYGKDAKATIDLIERGNYNNQRIIVPPEQLEEIRAYFKAKRSHKTITDHIDFKGVHSKPLSKANAVKFKEKLQPKNLEDSVMPEVKYTDAQVPTLVGSVVKQAGKTAFLASGMTAGITCAHSLINGEPIDPEQVAKDAVVSGVDTGAKVATASAINIALPQITSAIGEMGVAAVATIGIENAKTLYKVSTGELLPLEGADQMGRTTCSVFGGFWAMSKVPKMAESGAATGTALGSIIGGVIGSALPGVGTVAGATTGAKVGAMVGKVIGTISGVVTGAATYMAGSKIGEAAYESAKKVAHVAKEVASTVVSGVREIGHGILNSIRSFAFSW